MSHVTTEYFHPKTTPDVSVRLAVRMSMALPGRMHRNDKGQRSRSRMDLYKYKTMHAYRSILATQHDVHHIHKLDLNLDPKHNLNQGAVALTVWSVPRRIVPKLRHFHWLLKMNYQWKWRNLGTILPLVQRPSDHHTNIDIFHRLHTIWVIKKCCCFCTRLGGWGGLEGGGSPPWNMIRPLESA